MTIVPLPSSSSSSSSSLQLSDILFYLPIYFDYRDCYQLMNVCKSFYQIIHQYHSLSFFNMNTIILSSDFFHSLPRLYPSLYSLSISSTSFYSTSFSLYERENNDENISSISSYTPNMFPTINYLSLLNYLRQYPIRNLSLIGYQIIQDTTDLSPSSSLHHLPPSSHLTSSLPSYSTSPPPAPPSTSHLYHHNSLKKLTLINIKCSLFIMYSLCNTSNLQELTIISSIDLNDKLLCKLFTILPLLSTLDLKLCFNLQKLIYSSPLSISSLRYLHIIKCCQFISITSLTTLISCQISHSSAITSLSLEQLIQYNRSLKILIINSCHNLKNHLRVISYSLNKLIFQSNSFLQSITLVCPVLRQLLLTNCYQLSSIDLYSMNCIQNLNFQTLINLEFLHITSLALQSINLTGCQKLLESMKQLYSFSTSSSIFSYYPSSSHSHHYSRHRYYSFSQEEFIHSMSTPSSPSPSQLQQQRQQRQHSRSTSSKPCRQNIYCCLCQNLSSTCHLPPSWLHYSDTSPSIPELNSNVDVMNPSRGLFRPSYRCFYSLNISFCCPSLLLSKIIYPFDEEMEENTRDDEEQQQRNQQEEEEEDTEEKDDDDDEEDLNRRNNQNYQINQTHKSNSKKKKNRRLTM